MAYSIIVSPRAQQEIENAIDYYILYSKNAPSNFVTALVETYHVLETSPFFRIRYKNVRALKLKRFPYSLYFVINEETNIVRILSCFNNYRHPGKRP